MIQKLVLINPMRVYTFICYLSFSDVQHNTSFVDLLQNGKIGSTSSAIILPDRESLLCSSSIGSKGINDSSSDLNIQITPSTPLYCSYDDIDAVYYSDICSSYAPSSGIKAPDKPMDAAGHLM